MSPTAAVASPSVAVGDPIDLYLTANGLGTGAIDALLNFSGGASAPWFLQPPAGQVWRIERMFITVSSSAAQFAASDKYGSAALANGIRPQIISDAKGTHDLGGGTPITYVAGWAEKCFDEAPLTGFAGGAAFRIYRWSFFLDHCEGIRLDGDDNGRLSFLMQDDLREATLTINRNRFLCKGQVELVR